jgi:hypothetical protein
MSLESHQSMIVLAPPAQTRPAIPLEVPSEAAALPARSPEEIRAVEAVFAQQEKESATAAGLLFMPTATMILRDILVDTFAEPVDEVEVEPKAKKGKD